MNTRDTTRTVTDLRTLPTTERECHVCDDGMFVLDGHELICDTCQYAPAFEERRTHDTAWDRHDKQVRKRADSNKRPMLVGGYPDAYWQNGEYSYVPDSGRFVRR